MPFFLLGKSADDRLTLLSEAVFETRSDALAELSRMTSDPDFSAWDDDVMVFELGSGAAVLLMRPAPAAPVAEAYVEEPSITADVDDVVDESGADSFATEAQDAAVFEAPLAEEVEAEDTAILETEVAPEPVVESGIDFEPGPVIEVDATWAAAVEESIPAPEEEVSLRDALLKTAFKMESEGIVAPESIGPEEPYVDPAEEPSSESAEESAPTDEAAAWPWDVAAADAEAAPAFELNVLEEPGTDEVSLVRAPGDDETMSSARPVIMGSYAEPQDNEPPSDASPMAQISEPMGVAEPMSEPSASGDGSADASGISDFILDLETTAAADAPGYEGSPADLTEMTCNDCVYVETCPHKEGSDPRTCGSFQWK
ncbi:MAG: hypothetical protein CVT67_00915 [Actinobacteria bacterium HGW-Actinobacteria-7]|jgi:hypothetical protein|nr:MAG: hypothetical protein CVT67_00915 [Actinobacteria bacterium HGW-Actinobacteria-7]